MSKASEIAAAYAKLHESRFAPKKWAYVQNDGKLRIEELIFAPADALALAAWIVETFGESPLDPKLEAIYKQACKDVARAHPDLQAVTITRDQFWAACATALKEWQHNHRCPVGSSAEASVILPMLARALGFPEEKGGGS